ncbi:acetyl-CoA synthetase [Candidatus Woesearchaeota archaeon]|nr:acetyl-CoA synthetase [Candidatus Woesearchaeota archaeon]
MKNLEESLKIVGNFLPVVDHQVVKHIEDVKQDFPMVLKIVSDKISHKTDVNGVRIVKDEKELKKEFASMMKIKNVKAILAQKFVEGTEVIIGLKKDAAFGHALMFGIGGVMVELLKDVSFRICPISKKDAEEMINELKAKKLLIGFRGKEPVNLSLLKKCLVQASEIPKKYPYLKELDINPLIINEKKALVVDARMDFSDK